MTGQAAPVRPPERPSVPPSVRPAVPLPTYAEGDRLLVRSEERAGQAGAAADAVLADVIACMFRTGRAGTQAAALRREAQVLARRAEEAASEQAPDAPDS